MGDIAADKKITTSIKSALVKKDGKLGLAVKTYCFLGRVTLLGQLADEGFKDVLLLGQNVNSYHDKTTAGEHDGGYETAKGFRNMFR